MLAAVVHLGQPRGDREALTVRQRDFGELQLQRGGLANDAEADAPYRSNLSSKVASFSNEGLAVDDNRRN